MFISLQIDDPCFLTAPLTQRIRGANAILFRRSRLYFARRRRRRDGKREVLAVRHGTTPLLARDCRVLFALFALSEFRLM